jgi:REP-associated tyrosine transposase
MTLTTNPLQQDLSLSRIWIESELIANLHACNIEQIMLGNKMENANKSLSHAVYNIKLHIVLVTKYRRKTLTPDVLEYLEEAFAEILDAWRCKLIEFGGESDHVHLLVDIHPALDISVLINNLKTASARRCGNRFADHLKTFYWKPMFWHRAYYVGSVGGATLETVRAYVDAQGTEEHTRKARAKAKSTIQPSA